MTTIETHISTGVANEDLATANAWRTSDHVVLFAIAGFRLPFLDPCLLINGNQPTVGGPDNDEVLGQRETPIQASQPGLEKRARGPVRERFVSPEQFSGLKIVGENLALRPALEDSSISDERIAYQPIPGRKIDRPGEP